MARSNVPFGRPVRDEHFLFEPQYVPLNHGSFGTYPKSVRDRLREIQDLAEARPDTWLRYDFPKLLDESRAELATCLGIPPSDLVFVPNATTGVNIVLRSLVFEKGDVIVHFSTLYGGCANTVNYVCEITAAESVSVRVEYPIDDAILLERFRAAMREIRQTGRTPKIALFDTISSLPGVRVPWEKLCEICRDLGVLSLVDGAHGIGQIKLQLDKARPDFFVSNCHKWLYVPRGCAIFYVPESNQKLIRSSLPTSWGFEPLPKERQGAIVSPYPPSSRNPFQDLFAFVATADEGPYLCIPEALRFREEACGGADNIQAYCLKLAIEGGQKVANILGTEVMDNREKTLTQCAMFNVRLPIAVGGPGEVKSDDVALITAYISCYLAREYETFIATYRHGKAFWARFSSQIYLDIEDMEWGAKVLKELCSRVNRGEHIGWKAPA